MGRCDAEEALPRCRRSGLWSAEVRRDGKGRRQGRLICRVRTSEQTNSENGHEWMEEERLEVSRSVCRGGAVEEGKSVGMIKVPASLSGFRPVRWSRSSATSTPTKGQRLIQRNYMVIPLYATHLRSNAKINRNHIVCAIRTHPERLES